MTGTWREREAEHRREYSRQYHERNREQVLAAMRKRSRERNLEERLGITREEAQALLETAPDACEICGRTGRITEDHDHEARTHRGWLCGQCNSGLGQFGDDPSRLRLALTYLEERSCRP